MACRGDDGSSEDPPNTPSTVPSPAVVDQTTAFVVCLSMPGSIAGRSAAADRILDWGHEQAFPIGMYFEVRLGMTAVSESACRPGSVTPLSVT